MATVYGSVRQSGGFITVESELGRGAAFSVYLPLSGRGTGPTGEAASPSESTGGNETILLVEDADVVRELTSKALELEGYTVLAAATPGDALALAEREDYDLLLTDVVMPQMRGGELARRLSAQRPGLKVLFMSGYLDGEALLGEEAPSAFLQKPFKVSELAATVRELLDS
ncbi:MAG: response regulator [Thermoleophilia bacterium]|nr:response regulator [Thermoleophilia bacterium]